MVVVGRQLEEDLEVRPSLVVVGRQLEEGLEVHLLAVVDLLLEEDLVDQVDQEVLVELPLVVVLVGVDQVVQVDQEVLERWVCQ